MVSGCIYVRMSSSRNILGSLGILAMRCGEGERRKAAGPYTGPLKKASRARTCDTFCSAQKVYVLGLVGFRRNRFQPNQLWDNCFFEVEVIKWTQAYKSIVF